MSDHPDGALVSNDHLSVVTGPAPPPEDGGVGRAVPATDLVAVPVDAARRGDIDTLEHALAAGVPVDSRSPCGDSLLMLASYHGHVAAVGLLLGWGSDPDGRNAKGETPLAGVAFSVM